MSDSATLTKPVVTPSDVLPKKTNLLDARDRCDRCSAAAYVKIKLKKTQDNKDDTILTFCGHHYAEVEMTLEPMLAEKPIDERYKLVHNKLIGDEKS